MLISKPTPRAVLVCGISWHSIHPEFGVDKSMRLAELRSLFETPGGNLPICNTATPPPNAPR
jgi:hypothetical protein